MRLDITKFPELKGDRRRTIYVSGLDLDQNDELGRLGYDCVELMTLPRETEQDHVDYLRAKLQAVEEGTIEADEESRKRVELEARAYGLLDPKRRNMQINVTAEAADIDRLLAWDSGRHTLAGNSTAIHAQPPKVKKND
jgi:hypothetical protein